LRLKDCMRFGGRGFVYLLRLVQIVLLLFCQVPVRDLPVSGFRVQGSGFRVQGTGFRVQGSGLRAQGSGFRVQSSEFRVQGPQNRPRKMSVFFWTIVSSGLGFGVSRSRMFYAALRCMPMTPDSEGIFRPRFRPRNFPAARFSLLADSKGLFWTILGG